MDTTPLTMKQVIEDMEVYLDATEINYQTIQKNSERIYRGTTRVIKTVFSLIGVLLIINVYFIYDFGKGIVSMASSMNEMYTHFGNMAYQVHGITQSVEKMAAHIEVLPHMAESMDSMNQTLTDMNTNMQLMEGEVGLMSNDINSINQDMTDMTQRFDQVNGNMDNIGNNVKQMSRTVPKI